MDDNTKVLVLYDGVHDACYVTKSEMFTSAFKLIERLRAPHAKLYQFRSIYFDDLDTWEEEVAWYTVNNIDVPQPFDEARFKFLNAFELLWNCGKEVYSEC